MQAFKEYKDQRNRRDLAGQILLLVVRPQQKGEGGPAYQTGDRDFHEGWFIGRDPTNLWAEENH